jgi:hypothetical protein
MEKMKMKTLLAAAATFVTLTSPSLASAEALNCAFCTIELPAELAPQQPQADLPTAPPTLSPKNLMPLSLRLAEINQLARLSMPIIIRHCGPDAVCRKEQTAAMKELANKEIAVAKAIRNPTTYAIAASENDTINSCLVMWKASEDFAAVVQCINDATVTTTTPSAAAASPSNTAKIEHVF